MSVPIRMRVLVDFGDGSSHEYEVRSADCTEPLPGWFPSGAVSHDERERMEFYRKLEDRQQRRNALLLRIGDLWRSDWSGHSFDGHDGQGWIGAAVNGDAAALTALDAELKGYEEGS